MSRGALASTKSAPLLGNPNLPFLLHLCVMGEPSDPPNPTLLKGFYPSCLHPPPLQHCSTLPYRTRHPDTLKSNTFILFALFYGGNEAVQPRLSSRLQNTGESELYGQLTGCLWGKEVDAWIYGVVQAQISQLLHISDGTAQG